MIANAPRSTSVEKPADQEPGRGDFVWILKRDHALTTAAPDLRSGSTL